MSRGGVDNTRVWTNTLAPHIIVVTGHDGDQEEQGQQRAGADAHGRDISMKMFLLMPTTWSICRADLSPAADCSAPRLEGLSYEGGKLDRS